MIMMEEEYKKALSHALNLFSHNDRTEDEIRSRLKLKGYSDDIIEQVIDKLTAEGFVNDRRYAEYYVTCYGGKRSRKRIEKELLQKGISQDIISEYLTGADDNEALVNALRKQLRRRNIEYGNDIPGPDREKIIAALKRQGFGYADIKSCMNDE